MNDVPIPPRVRHVIHAVAEHHGVSVDDLMGRSTKRVFSDPRRDAMRACRRLLFPSGRPPSFQLIGRWFDRDHSTILHACKDLYDLDGEQLDLFDVAA